MRAEHPNTPPPYDFIEWSTEDLRYTGRVILDALKAKELSPVALATLQRHSRHLSFEFRCRQLEALVGLPSK